MLALALAGLLLSFRANPAPIWWMSFIAAQLRPPSTSNSVCFFTASAMALRYSTMQLRQLFPQMPPSTELIDTLKNTRLLLHPHYINRGFRRKCMYSSSAINTIPSLWSDRISYPGSHTSSSRHHNNTRHQNDSSVNTFNLHPIPTSAQSIQTKVPKTPSSTQDRSTIKASFSMNLSLTSNFTFSV